MCGIAGFVSFNNLTATYADKSKFAFQALYLSALRGTDGTGIAFVEKATESPLVFKKGMASYDFLNLKRTDKIFLSIEKYKAVLLHTRSSTRSAVSDENSHPFQEGHITLIHNGHVSNSRTLVNGRSSYDVDSAHVCEAFAESGALNVLPKINGDYCFVWHDAKEGTFNIARNKGRPLFYAHIPDWDGIAFMSEHQMLAGLLNRTGIKISNKGYFYPQEHTLLRVDLNKSAYTEEFIPFVPETARARGPTHGGSTGATGTTTSHTDSDRPHKLREIYAARQLLTDHYNAGAGTPTKRSKVVKARNRLKALGLEYMETYGATPLIWAPYYADKGAGTGFLVAKLEGSLRTKCPPVILHGIPRDEWVDLKKLGTLYINLYNTLLLNGSDLVLIGDLDLDKAVDMPEDEEEEEAHGEVTLLRGPGGAYIPEHDWERLVKDGCGMCTGVVTKEFANYVDWQGTPATPICHECSGLMAKAS